MSRVIYKGNVPVGGDNPISVQSMTNTDTRDVAATVAQIKRLELAGCEIIRVAVPDDAAAAALPQIKQQINIPLIADIHFDYNLALKAVAAGVDGLRLNPGNIPKPEQVKEVVKAAKERHLPIRIGVNSGSLPKDILAKFGGHPTPAAMVESALRHVEILEELDYQQIVVSLKSSEVRQTIEANQLFALERDYPLHLGITEAGPLQTGTIRSAVGLGGLLLAGLGDTVRVSLTADPVEEVRVAYEILKCLNLRQHGPMLISCPTCGRTEIDIISIATEVEKRLLNVKKPLKIAVMGCVVNGPGEAKEADFGIAGGHGVGLIFAHGEIIKKVKETELVDSLLALIAAAEHE